MDMERKREALWTRYSLPKSRVCNQERSSRYLRYLSKEWWYFANEVSKLDFLSYPEK
jgi:hypothetical protein